MKLIRYCLLLFTITLLAACELEREPFPLPEDTPTAPVGDRLQDVLRNPSSGYNTILIDPLNPDLPQDFKDRWAQATEYVKEWNYNGSTGRKLNSMYIHFGEDDTVDIIVLYSVMASTYKTIARFTYTLALDENGVGKLQFVEQNANAANVAPQLTSVLAYFLEEYSFQLDWVDDGIATSPTASPLGGFFRTDDPDSYFFGPLSKIDEFTTSTWPQPTTPTIPKFFTHDNPIDYPLYTSISVNPDDPSQPQAFQDLWNAAKNELQDASGRQLHQFIMVFDPDFSRMRLMVYYYTASGGKSSAFYRYIPNMYFDDTIKFDFNSEDANAAIIRTPGLMDDFFESHTFTISETSSPSDDGKKYVTLSSTSDPDLSFTGYLDNLSASCCTIWPE